MQQPVKTKKNFVFQNQPLVLIPKKPAHSFISLQKSLLYSSCFVVLCFVSLKGFYGFKSQSPAPPVFKSTESKKDHVVPLLLNLKSQQGPRLARVQVFISLSPAPNSAQVSNPKDLEKQLLFLLSGQPLQELTKKTFQNRIQNQLNAFLSGAFIKDLDINMEVLN